MRRYLYLSLAIVALGVAGALLVGGSLAAPRMHPVGEPPSGFPAVVVTIPGTEGVPVAGWFAAGDSDKAGILLLHGVRSDRRQMTDRARFLLEAGYSVLLIDLQAHGETPGKQITFGFRESADAHAALSYLRDRVGGRKVGVIGVSLGGAAALLGQSPVEADAVVLEAVYSTIQDAVKNRMSMRLGGLGAYLAPLITWQIEPRLGVPVEALSPLRAISRLDAPVMVIGGAEDRHTRQAESRRLFEEARGPKRFWLIEGAGHQNFHAFSGREYENRVLAFLQQFLQGSDT